MNAPHDTLFLHWGPGGCAHVERQLLGTALPQVYFWDQPAIQQEAGAFERLLEAACVEVARMGKDIGRPVKLMAHSFGGHLVSALLERLPEQIGDCHLVSTGFDIPRGFRNLLDIVAGCGTTEAGLRENVRDLLAATKGKPADRHTLRDTIDLICSDPDVLRCYWPSRGQHTAYGKIAANGPAFDLDTFLNVLNDFVARHAGSSVACSGSRRVVIELGGRDPLLVLEQERRDWLCRFPAAEIVIRPDSGHFIHLEPFLPA